MNLTQNELKPGAVAITSDGKIAVITGFSPNRPKNPILLSFKPGGTTYVSSMDRFTAVVGQVDLEAYKKAGVSQVPLWNPLSSVESFGLPPNIKAMDLKPGDLIRYRHGGKTVTVSFKGFNWNRPKYPVSYELRGKSWKGQVVNILGKALFGSSAVTPPVVDDQAEADGASEAASS